MSSSGSSAITGRSGPVAMNEADLRLLLRVVLMLEGELLVGNIDRAVANHMVQDLQRESLLAADAGVPELRLELSNLGLRLRAALGEGDLYPDSHDGVTLHWFAFPSRQQAEAFTRELGSEQPWAIEEENTVAVTVTDLPLSERFDELRDRLIRIAKEHDGDGRGWGW